MRFKVFNPSFDIRHSLFDILRFVLEVLNKLSKLRAAGRYFFPVSPACRACCLARCRMISPSIR
jgi:hypothetical protein